MCRLGCWIGRVVWRPAATVIQRLALAGVGVVCEELSKFCQWSRVQAVRKKRTVGAVPVLGHLRISIFETDLHSVRINRPGTDLPAAVDGHLDSAELFRRFGRFVASFLLRMGVPRSDLDDLMQEVFLVAHKNGGYTPGAAKPTTYLANIAFKATVSHRRKRKTRSFVRADAETVSRAGESRGTPEQNVSSSQEIALLQRALDTLDEDKRAVFVMAELQGESVVDIAAGLGIPVDTAYSRLRAARKLFRKAATRLELVSTADVPPRAEGSSQ